MTADDGAISKSKDWTRRPVSRLFWWGLPVLVVVSTDFLKLTRAETAFALAATFGWAGTGCLLNARRCGRRHCFFSGPVLLLGAIAAVLVGAGVITDAHALNYVVWGTTILFLLSFVPEAIWGKYARAS